MGLQWAVCGVCEERHLLQRSGAMSIHTTAAGERCAGPVIAPAPIAAKPKVKPARDTSYPELQAAFDFAADDRLERKARPTNQRLDRRIYVTSRIQTVPGGLPGLGKR